LVGVVVVVDATGGVTVRLKSLRAVKPSTTM